MSFNFLCYATENALPDGWLETLEKSQYPVVVMPPVENKVGFCWRPFLFMFDTEISVADLDRLNLQFSFFYCRYERELNDAVRHLFMDPYEKGLGFGVGHVHVLNVKDRQAYDCAVDKLLSIF